MKTKKRCAGCGKRLPAILRYFSPHRLGKNGLQPRCKICRREYYYRNRNVYLKQRKKYGGTIRGHLIHVFHSINSCCNNPKDQDYKNFGAKGIKCLFASDEFVGYVINDMKVDPRGLQISRINKLDHFKKGNIHFISHPNTMAGVCKLSTQRGQPCSSRFKGVCWDKEHKKWRARITVNGKTHSLGRYIDEVDSARAYDVAAEKYFGVYALTNKMLKLL